MRNEENNKNETQTKGTEMISKTTGNEIKFRALIDCVAAFAPVSPWFDNPTDCSIWCSDNNVAYDFINPAANWWELNSYN